MVSSYTANLAAFLVIESVSSPIKSYEDLAACGVEGAECPVTFGAKKQGSTYNFFKVVSIITKAQRSASEKLFRVITGS